MENKGIKFELLDWDTKYFGMSAARINFYRSIREEDEKKILEFCDLNEFITLANYDNSDENNHWIGSNTEAFLVDMNIKFSKPIKYGNFPKIENTYIVNNYDINSYVQEISTQSFKYSRFFNDKNIPDNKSRYIYRQWVENSFNRNDKFFVIHEENNIVMGYLLFSFDNENCTIELFSVGQEYQGKGIGKGLFKTLEDFLSENKINEVTVGTQIDNKEAIVFYTSLDFIYKSCNSIYHLWKKK